MSRRTLRFTSFARSATTGYLFIPDGMALWDSAYNRSGGVLWMHAGEFVTLGDGICQHGHERAVGSEHFGDYCASLARCLMEQVGIDDDDREAIVGAFPHPPGRSEIDFALSLKYQEDKPSWYCKSERKVSRAESKRHDKRWEETPRWADGSVESAYRLLTEGGGGIDEVLVRYVRYSAIRDHVATMPGGYYAEHPHRYFKLDGDNCTTGQAHATLAELVASFRAADNARRQLACYVGNTRRQVETAEASTTTEQ